MKYLNLLLAIVIFQAAAYANPAGDMTEIKIKTDLEETVGRVAPKERFLVQVFTQFETVSEKKLVEGETTSQNNPSQEIIVPPLPGFQPSPIQTQNIAPQQNRQTFKMVDKDVLKHVSVNVTLDSQLESELINQIKNLVQTYLSSNYGSHAAVHFSEIKMLPVEKPESSKKGYLEYLPWALLYIAVCILVWIFIRSFIKKKTRTVYPTVVHPGEELVNTQPQSFRQFPDEEKKPLALPASQNDPKGNFPALPASQDFANRRSELLDTFLKNSEVFRIYFERLAEGSKRELYAGLRGPAFDSLLETLGLEVPNKGEVSSPPSEEQILFYFKNFDEFIQAHQWQQGQFFGFLRQLTQDQLTTLARQENPLVSAILIKFMKPEQSAKILTTLEPNQRAEILSQFSRISNLTTDELRSIEQSVREHAAQMPKLLLGYNREEADFWSGILSQADDQEAILFDLEKTRPDLYPLLAKYRFKLEDIPSLPQPLISKVLNEVDNEELALGLLTCPKDLTDFVMNELNPNRRQLVSSQLVTFNGLSGQKPKEARQSLTLRFREVMV